ncbi:MAG TPA: response regulator, partial [Fibrobacteraceae bacterium]|nr:response regulator [Fibrobacteraceae bacterium]
MMPICESFIALVVDDDPAELEILRRAMTGCSPEVEFQIVTAGTLAEAFSVMDAQPVHLVILDLNLPDSRGFPTFERFQDRHFGVPVVVVTAQEDEQQALRTIRLGAQDYIVKGLFRPELTARAMRFAIERHRIVASHLGKAMHDDLTGVYNRRGFLEFAGKQLSLAVRDEKDLVLLYMDLDNMKMVNDS